MRRIRGFYVSDEERAFLERYLAVIRECPEEKVHAATFTVDTYFCNHTKGTGFSKNEKGI
ncbi:MAG: hypothetical protein A2052_03705 [Deltaproteobacteria bacterium GWA2_54_12]|nr:MAG: hypothetical protein A2052_03705 [Deltaproteobacteria bacterium GWA2_54_12]